MEKYNYIGECNMFLHSRQQCSIKCCSWCSAYICFAISTVASCSSGSGATVCTTFHTLQNPTKQPISIQSTATEKKLNKCICAGDKANSCWKLSPLLVVTQMWIVRTSWKCLSINNDCTAPHSIPNQLNFVVQCCMAQYYTDCSVTECYRECSWRKSELSRGRRRAAAESWKCSDLPIIATAAYQPASKQIALPCLLYLSVHIYRQIDIRNTYIDK